MLLYIPCIYFSLLFFVLLRKHKGMDISAFLAAVYAFSAFCSIPTYILQLRDWQEMIPVIHALPTFAYCTLITICILPFSWLHTENITSISKPNSKIFEVFSGVMIFTFFITLINLFPDIKLAIQSGDWKEIRSSIYFDETSSLSGWRYIMAIPETLLSPCSPIMLIFFFYSVCFLNHSRFYNLLLLCASTTPILPAILIAGRTQIIYWFLNGLVTFFLFKPWIKREQLKFLLTLSVIFVSIGVIYTTYVAISRWKETNDTAEMLLLYAGEPFLFFCDFFDNYTYYSPHWQRLFPFTHYFILKQNIDLFEYREQIESMTGMNIGIFYTFLGDIMVDIGKIGMIAYVIIFSTLTRVVTKAQTDSYPFYRILLLMICIIVPLDGLFYYSFHTVRMSYYIIWTGILSSLFLYYEKHHD